MQQWDFSENINEAESGNPHMMLELAKLYKSGVLDDPNCFRYVYWLNRFFEAPVIQKMVEELEEKYCQDNSARMCRTNYCTEYTNPTDEFLLRGDIIEAGMALGIYYSNSSKIEELELSASCLVAALDASAWDNLEYQTIKGERESILSLLRTVHERKEKLEVQRNEK